MTEPAEIRKVVSSIKARRNDWIISERRKNDTLPRMLAIPKSEILDIIFNVLNWRDYSSGPEDDKNKIPGKIWIFGLTISEIDCYLKFQDRPSGVIVWISVHPAEYPMRLPFR